MRGAYVLSLLSAKRVAVTALMLPLSAYAFFENAADMYSMATNSDKGKVVVIAYIAGFANATPTICLPARTYPAYEDAFQIVMAYVRMLKYERSTKPADEVISDALIGVYRCKQNK